MKRNVPEWRQCEKETTTRAEALSQGQADKEETTKIKEAALLFDMMVPDHIIVSADGYYSFADEGIL